MTYFTFKLIRTIAIYLIVFTKLASCRSALQNHQLDGYVQEKVNYSKEDIEDSDTLNHIVHINKDFAVIYIFEEFNDTLCLYSNGRLEGKWAVFKANNPTESSGYSGINYSIKLNKKKNLILMKLLNEKTFISFLLDNEYPLYTIQRYDKVWYVNARFSKLILK